jgi:hypothetical protein
MADSAISRVTRKDLQAQNAQNDQCGRCLLQLVVAIGVLKVIDGKMIPETFAGYGVK